MSSTILKLDRREFLSRSLSVVGLMHLWPLSARAWQDGYAPIARSWPRVLGTWQRGEQNFVGLWNGEQAATGIALSFRAHQLLRDPLSATQAVVVARRPGESLARVDLDRHLVLNQISTETNRRFNGHAAFSLDGTLLFTSENDSVTGEGIIGIRDSRSLAKRTEVPSGGIGPHALIVEQNGTLLVANGGILDVLSPGVPNIAIERMNPSLTRIDPTNGSCLGKWLLPDQQLSIRHMVRESSGTVGVALQAANVEQTERNAAPVLAIFDGKAFRLAEMPAGRSLRGYAGDVTCVQLDGIELFAAGCTAAGLLGLWDKQGKWVGAVTMPEACAVASWGQTVVAATSIGQVALVNPVARELVKAQHTDMRWDNHMIVWDETGASL